MTLPDALDVMRRAAHWAVGVPREAVRYARRSVPIYRTEVEAAPMDGRPLEVSPLPGELASGVQRAHSGTGPDFHRTYSVHVVGAQGGAEQVIANLRRDFSGAVPEGMVEVDESATQPLFGVGDELRIRLAGPWDAPVRVIEVGPTHFRFATLDGHMEAGEIQFSATDVGEPGDVDVMIQSWARSSTRAFAALYHPLGIAKEVQLHMWATVLERVAERAGGEIEDGIRVITRRGEHARA